MLPRFGLWILNSWTLTFKQSGLGHPSGHPLPNFAKVHIKMFCFSEVVPKHYDSATKLKPNQI